MNKINNFYIKNISLLILLLGISTLEAQTNDVKFSTTIFTHTTTMDNLDGSTTILDHPHLNGHPERMVFVQATGKKAEDAFLGVLYDGLHWRIFYQNQEDISEGVSFSVMSKSRKRFKLNHITTTDNTKENITVLSSNRFLYEMGYLLSPTLGEYNNHPLAINYNGKTNSYEIVNSDGEELPIGANFHIYYFDYFIPYPYPKDLKRTALFTPSSLHKNEIKNNLFYINKKHFLEDQIPEHIFVTPHYSTRKEIHDPHPVAVKQIGEEWVLFHPNGAEFDEKYSYTFYIVFKEE